MSFGKSVWYVSLWFIFFSILKMFSVYQNKDGLFLQIALALFLAMLVSESLSEHVSVRLRFIGLLFLLLPGVSICGVMEELLPLVKDGAGRMPMIAMAFAVAVPVLVTGFTILKGDLEIPYWKIKQIFLRVCILFVVQLLISCILNDMKGAHVNDAAKAVIPFIDIKVIFSYQIAYMVLTVLALNVVRFGNAINRTLKGMYATVLALYLAVSAFVGWLIFFVMSHSSRILEILLFPVGWVMYLYSLLMNYFSKNMKPEKTEIVEQEIAETIETIQDLPNVVSEKTEDTVELSDNVITILNTTLEVVFIIALLSLALYALYRLFVFLKNQGNLNEEETKLLGTIGVVEGNQTTRRKLFKSNREKIRRYYWKHMLEIKKKGFSIQKSCTSKQIYEEGVTRLSNSFEQEERLQKLYIKARYSEENITEEDVKEMKKLI